MALACYSICLALNIVFSNAEVYTHISNALVGDVYTAAGYMGEYVQKWKDEGKAISKALTFFHSPETDIFGKTEERIEFIVGSTGANTSTYIYGEAERLKNTELPLKQKPSKIIVVYTLNYVNESAAQEYTDFKKAMDTLIEAGKSHSPPINVDVRQFRPVVEGKSTLDVQCDYQNFGQTEMDVTQLTTQQGIIYALHTQVKETAFVTSDQFEKLLDDPNIKVIVDGVMDSEAKSIDGSNQLLTAIPRAQIRIMGKAILALDTQIIVISNDNPSGMEETGNWTINSECRYPVHFILSRVWNKELVNYVDLKGIPIILVLDIEYNGTRLFDKLLTMIPDGNHVLKQDVAAASQIKGGVITFTFAQDYSGRAMVDDSLIL